MLRAIIQKADTEEYFETLLKKWYFWATHSQLVPVIKAAKTIKAHWEGVLEWKRTKTLLHFLLKK